MKQVHYWLLPVLGLLFSAAAAAQSPSDVSNSTNYGAASWGVGTGTNSFNVSGPYDATSNLATDYFYDSNNPAGTAIEISGNTAPGFYTLILDNGAAAVIANTAGIDITGSLQLLNGITTTNNNIAGAIRFSATASTAGSGAFDPTRYIDGYVGKLGAAAFTFPVGNAGIYSPLTFSNPAGTTLRYTKGDVGTTAILDNTQGALNLHNVSTAEYYSISSASTTGSTITMPYGNFGGAYVTDPSTLTIGGWDGSKWINLGSLANSVNTTDKTITVSLNQDLGGFSQIALASTSTLNALPVTLVSFAGNSINCTALLNWKTATEQNNGYYDIEVSTDAAHFAKAGSVASRNMPNGSSYEYSYDDMGGSTRYFRLKMADNDGHFTYSNTIAIASRCNGGNAITIAPNPVNDVVNIYGLAGKNNITITDALGRQMIRVQSAGVSLQQIPVSRLVPGTYMVQVVHENGTITTGKIVKL